MYSMMFTSFEGLESSVENVPELYDPFSEIFSPIKTPAIIPKAINSGMRANIFLGLLSVLFSDIQ